MKTRNFRKLTACFTALALATTGLVAGVGSGGVSRAHACSATYSISAGNYAHHGQQDSATWHGAVRINWNSK